MSELSVDNSVFATSSLGVSIVGVSESGVVPLLLVFRSDALGVLKIQFDFHAKKAKAIAIKPTTNVSHIFRWSAVAVSVSASDNSAVDW